MPPPPTTSSPRSGTTCSSRSSSAFATSCWKGSRYHSRIPFRTLDVPRGAKVLDVGCGWGDTAIELARMTGPSGSVLGLDCCDAFLEKGRADARAAGPRQRHVRRSRRADLPLRARIRPLLLALRDDVLHQSRRRDAQRPDRAQARRPARVRHVADDRRQPVARPAEARRARNSCRRPARMRRRAGPVRSRWRIPTSWARSSRRRASSTPTFARVDGPVMVGRDVEQAIEFQMALGPAGEIVREAGRASRGAQGRDRARIARRARALPAAGRIHRPAVELVDDHRTQSRLGAHERGSTVPARVPGERFSSEVTLTPEQRGGVRARRRRRQSGASRSAIRRRHALRPPDRERPAHDGAAARADGGALLEARRDARPRVLAALPEARVRRRDDPARMAGRQGDAQRVARAATSSNCAGGSRAPTGAPRSARRAACSSPTRSRRSASLSDDQRRNDLASLGGEDVERPARRRRIHHLEADPRLRERARETRMRKAKRAPVPSSTISGACASSPAKSASVNASNPGLAHSVDGLRREHDGRRGIPARRRAPSRALSPVTTLPDGVDRWNFIG